ncbi:hypothetical protein CSPAE12_01130 [Colletotrichum incanum]|nr:hypothetical protein CSPAE12_01130 [Colletotrichum incanum]
MSAKTTPTLSSSGAKGKAPTIPKPQSLDQEIKEADSSSNEEDATAELAKQLKRANKDIANM